MISHNYQRSAKQLITFELTNSSRPEASGSSLSLCLSFERSFFCSIVSISPNRESESTSYSSIVTIDSAMSLPLGGMRCLVTLPRSPLLLAIPSGDCPGSSPRKAYILDTIAARESGINPLHTISLRNSIIRCAWNKSFLVLCTELEIVLYSLSSLAPSDAFVLRRRKSIYCPLALASSLHSKDKEEDPLLCFPSPEEVGLVAIFRCRSRRLESCIRVYAPSSSSSSSFSSSSSSAISALSLCPSNRRLFAAAERNEIRVFSLPSGDHLFSISQSYYVSTSNPVVDLRICPHGRYLLALRKNSLDVCALPSDETLHAKTSTSLKAISDEKKNQLDQDEVEDDGFVQIQPVLAPSSAAESADSSSSSSVWSSWLAGISSTISTLSSNISGTGKEGDTPMKVKPILTASSSQLGFGVNDLFTATFLYCDEFVELKEDNNDALSVTSTLAPTAATTTMTMAHSSASFSKRKLMIAVLTNSGVFRWYDLGVNGSKLQPMTPGAFSSCLVDERIVIPEDMS